MQYLNQILHPQNLKRAIRQVVKNKGCSGVDGMQVEKVEEYLNENWPAIKAAILSGRYQPRPILGKEIDKASGGKRLLGIPCAIDRVIQQMIHQILCPIYDVEFSGFSYGFRPNRSAHQAIHQALDYINEGYQDIIDLDLKSFFDIVNHDYLMSLLYRKIKDERLLRLIRKYLKADMMLGGLAQQRTTGCPQGSPLSPLLSNIILNELDQVLTPKGYKFVRYADDCSIFLSSQQEARKVLRWVTKFIEQKLHLQINKEKTKICRPVNFHILGYNFVGTYRAGSKGEYRLRISQKSFSKMKAKVKEITRKTRPLSFSERIKELNSYMRGWVNYFRFAHAIGKLNKLDTWIRSRLRYCIWKHWKKPKKRTRSLIRLGVSYWDAYRWARSRMSPWAIACSPIMRTTVTIDRLKRKGYIPFNEYYQQVKKLEFPHT